MLWTQMIPQILKPVDERCVITLIRIISPDNVKREGGGVPLIYIEWKTKPYLQPT